MLALAVGWTSLLCAPRARAREQQRGRACRPVALADKRGAAAPAARLVDGEWEVSQVDGVHTLRVAVAGKELEFETGRMARQAMGSVIAKAGDTHVYSACCFEKVEELKPIDFTPLRVDYFERSSAAGMTKGGYIKRDGRPSEHETLVSRLIDRPIRPIMPDGWCLETQITSYVLAYDGVNLPDVIAMCAASASLALSGVPCPKPVAAVRVALLEDVEAASAEEVVVLLDDDMEDVPVPLPEFAEVDLASGGEVADSMDVTSKPTVRRFVINPSKEELERSSMNLVLAGTATDVLMIEGFCDFLPEETLIEGLEVGLAAVSTIASALSEWQRIAGKREHLEGVYASPPGLDDLVCLSSSVELRTICTQQVFEEAMKGDNKTEREESGLYALERSVITRLTAASEEEGAPPPPTAADVRKAFKKAASAALRRMVARTGCRQDGRATTEVRPISILMEPLPGQVHGSVLFTRGETQSLATATLGDSSMAQRFEDLEGEGSKRFYLQYVFPPFSVGEVGRIGAPGRREVGHGNLAERALLPAVPSEEVFPYCLRVESLITESCGSSSMASVCGGCLAMMAAGVPVTRPVAGVAMGLLLDEEGEGEEPIILTDILGSEDALGTMDFKVAGDEEGVTAFQLDIKCEGLSLPLMRRALQQAREGRLHILDLMADAMPEPAASLPDSLPRVFKMRVSADMVRKIIGKGGDTINSIIADSGVTNIGIEKNGEVSISGRTDESIQAAKKRIEDIVASEGSGGRDLSKAPPPPPISLDEEFNNVEVKNVVPFGMFVELHPGVDGFCHISEISSVWVSRIEDVQISVGDRIDVKVTQINEQKGQYRVVPTSNITVISSGEGGGRPKGRGGGQGRGRGNAKLPRRPATTEGAV